MDVFFGEKEESSDVTSRMRGEESQRMMILKEKVTLEIERMSVTHLFAEYNGNNWIILSVSV